MTKVSIIGIDLAKRVFQVHGANAGGTVCFRKKLSQQLALPILKRQPSCIVAMEACAGAHYWGARDLALGHDVRLIAPRYVKLIVKRQKNDMADAEAIAEAALRATIRFVPIKSRPQKQRAVFFRNRELLVKQRTQLGKALSD